MNFTKPRNILRKGLRFIWKELDPRHDLDGLTFSNSLELDDETLNESINTFEATATIFFKHVPRGAVAGALVTAAASAFSGEIPSNTDVILGAMRGATLDGAQFGTRLFLAVLEPFFKNTP